MVGVLTLKRPPLNKESINDQQNFWCQLKQHTCQNLTKSNEDDNVAKLEIMYANDMQSKFNRPFSKLK